MKTKTSVVILTALSLAFTGITFAKSSDNEHAEHAAQKGHSAHWGYEGDQGPDNWGKISPEYALCKTGKNQSPVNIKGSLTTAKKPLKIAYTGRIAKDIQNNGHTIQVNLNEGNTLILDKDIYTLRQFHFHAPSENEIDDKSYPLEAHFVHANKDDELTVLSVMFVEGKENSELNKIWQHMPDKVSKKELKESLDLNKLLPKKREYFRFSGSLTTPPCSEGVIWLVLKESITASKAQIEHFEKIIHHQNNRPVQPLNGRVIIKE